MSDVCVGSVTVRGKHERVREIIENIKISILLQSYTLHAILKYDGEYALRKIIKMVNSQTLIRWGMH